MKRPFLIDTDTASDDAVALMMALRSPDVEVLAITTVAGNVDVQQATRNALYTSELCGSPVPVYVGAEKPLKRAHVNAHWFHGCDGFGDHGYPAAKRSAEKEHAVDALIRILEANREVEIVTLAPLTNIAMALKKRQAMVSKIKRCVIMGGAPCCEGNVSPAAEYNIWCDPEAARIVIGSGMPIEMVGWHLCRGEAVLNRSDIEQILKLGTPLAKFALECNSFAQQAYLEQTGEHGIALPDPVAMAVALHPSMVTSQTEHFLEIETGSELTRGMTVVDRLNVAPNERNRDVWAERLAAGHKAKIIWTIDNPRWKQALFESLK